MCVCVYVCLDAGDSEGQRELCNTLLKYVVYCCKVSRLVWMQETVRDRELCNTLLKYVVYCCNVSHLTLWRLVHV